MKTPKNMPSYPFIVFKYIALATFAALATLVALAEVGCAHQAATSAESATSVTMTTSGEVPISQPDPVPTVASVNAAALPDVTLAPVAGDAPPQTRTTLMNDAPPIRPRPDEIPPMTSWGNRYPDAARLLAGWAREHDSTARRLAHWADRNPEQMSTLVDWSITNVSETVGAFFLNRSAFTEFQSIADTDRAGVEAFVLWIRRAPSAAKELAAHPAGLQFTTSHEGELAKAHAEGAASLR